MDEDLQLAGHDAIDQFFLKGFSDSEKKSSAFVKLHSRLQCRHYQIDEYIFHEGDPCLGIFYVREGLIAIRKTAPDGRNTLIRIATEGDVMGYRPFAAGESHRGGAKVLRPSQICFMPAEAVREMRKVDMSWEHVILRRTAAAQGLAEERLHEIATMSLRARLCHTLIILRDQFHRDGIESAESFELPISRTDLASMLGVRRESVSRAIHEFEQEGLAHFSDRYVEILKPRAMVEEYGQRV